LNRKTLTSSSFVQSKYRMQNKAIAD